MFAPLSIRRIELEEACLVTMDGELDGRSAGALIAALSPAVVESGDGPLIVDLCGARFMDSTGMSVLVNASRRLLRQGRGFAVICRPGPVMRVFELTGLGDTLRVSADLDEALARAGVAVAHAVPIGARS